MRGSIFKLPTIILARDTNSKDGWIGRASNGKVCFIKNLAEHQSKLVAGDSWKVKVSWSLPTYNVVELVEKAK